MVSYRKIWGLGESRYVSDTDGRSGGGDGTASPDTTPAMGATPPPAARASSSSSIDIDEDEGCHVITQFSPASPSPAPRSYAPLAAPPPAADPSVAAPPAKQLLPFATAPPAADPSSTGSGVGPASAARLAVSRDGMPARDTNRHRKA